MRKSLLSILYKLVICFLAAVSGSKKLYFVPSLIVDSYPYPVAQPRELNQYI